VKIRNETNTNEEIKNDVEGILDKKWIKRMDVWNKFRIYSGVIKDKGGEREKEREDKN